MGQLFERNFWVANLFFVASACLLIVRAGNVFVEGALLPWPGLGASPTGPRTAEEKSTLALSPERLAELTGLPVPTGESNELQASSSARGLDSAPVRSSLPLRLLGTLVNEIDPDRSLASLLDAMERRPETYRVHDVVHGAEIILIERTRVIVINGSRHEFIDWTSPSGPDVELARPSKTVPGEGIRRLGDRDYDIPSAELDRALSDLNGFAAHARIVPGVQDGRPGFRLFSIRPDSIYGRLGIENGDFVKRINGYDLTSPERILELYSTLRETTRIEIELDRNGTPVVNKYTVHRF